MRSFGSPRAAFSGDFEGIHLPAGYELGGERFANGALVGGAGGRLAPAAHVPELRTHDYLDRTESLVLAHLVKHVPEGLRPLALAFLGQVGSRGAPDPQP